MLIEFLNDERTEARVTRRTRWWWPWSPLVSAVLYRHERCLVDDDSFRTAWAFEPPQFEPHSVLVRFTDYWWRAGSADIEAAREELIRAEEQKRKVEPWKPVDTRALPPARALPKGRR